MTVTLLQCFVQMHLIKLSDMSQKRTEKTLEIYEIKMAKQKLKYVKPNKTNAFLS